MQFSPVITISDILNIIISLCAVITIIFTYLTLKEMKKQRNLSIMPNLIIEPQNSIEFIPDNGFIREKKFFILLKNVGNNVTKNLHMEVTIDNIEKFQSKKLKIDKNIISLNFKHCASLSIISDLNTFFYQSIQEKEIIKIDLITIDTLLLGLSANILENYNRKSSSEKLIKTIENHTVVFNVKLNFIDLANNKYEKDFKIKLSVNSIDFEKKRIQYESKILNIK